MKELFTTLLVCLILLLTSCANQGSISGGIKDNTPPKLIESTPPNGSTNFNSDGFTLRFDENIKVSNIQQNLLISPLLSEKPKIKIKAKSIEVKFMSPLPDSTTVALNFGNSIADLNEGNELSGFTYFFSTGEEIDSLTLTGKAIDAASGQSPELGMWACLYRNLEDSAFQMEAPNYVVPLQEDGSFSFQNISEGDYKVYVLRDANNNYYYDLASEEIGFLEDTITVNPTTTSVEKTIYTFVSARNKPRVSVINRGQKQSVSFEAKPSMGDISFTFFPEQSTPNYQSRYEDSIRFWLQPELWNSPPDSVQVSNRDLPMDTISLAILEGLPKDSTFKMYPKNVQSFSFHSDVYIHSPRPFFINENFKDGTILLEDSLFVAGGVPLRLDSTKANLYYIDYDWAYGKTYDVIFKDSSLINLFGSYSDSLSFRFTVPEKELLSSMIVNIQTEQFSQDDLVFQLLQGEKEILKKSILSTDKSLKINDLRPATFQARVLVDRNKNGIWDTGSFENKTQPERVLYFPADIQLKANWDIDVQINLDQ